MATPIFAAIKGDIRARLGEPSPGFWTDAELTDWYNEAIQLQHRAVWTAISQHEDRAYGVAFENDYAKLFLVKSSSASLVAGTQDYNVPTGFWRAVRVVIVVNGVECPCDFSPFADDWDVRNMPHCGPTPTRPKYSITPEGKFRFYVVPGKLTVPNSTNVYYIYHLKQPVTVVDTVTDTQVVEPFNAAPKAWVCYRAMIKQYDGGEQYLGEWAEEIKALVPGPAKETTDKKTVIVNKFYGAQPGGA